MRKIGLRLCSLLCVLVSAQVVLGQPATSTKPAGSGPAAASAATATASATTGAAAASKPYEGPMTLAAAREGPLRLKK
jgi:hypothetical protein